MIDIVIVDDEQVYHNKIKSIVSKIGIQYDTTINIKDYYNYDEYLESEIKNTDLAKIYILDINLSSSISGISIAKKIKEDDWNSEIIFITNHDKMFETIHRNIPNVYEFIEKFNDMEQRVEKALKKIISKKFDNNVFSYKNRTSDLKIYYKKILYIVRDKKERKLLLVTENSQNYISLSIDEILNMLDSRFIQVHRCCIVNKQRVQEYNWKDSTITFDTGLTIPYLCKTHKSEIDV